MMILKLRSPFKVAGDTDEDGGSKSKAVYYATSTSNWPTPPTTSSSVGLKILTQNPQGKSNIVLKTALKITLPVSKRNFHGHSGGRFPADDDNDPYSNNCFLKSCHLCHKKLSLDKEVYMYRGDQGFCSIECRSRQIMLDEMKEMEESTKKRVAFSSSRHCSSAAASSGRREIQLLLEDLRRRNNKPSFQNQNHWAIVS